MKRVDETRFPDHFWMGRIMPVTVYWYFSSWAYMKDWCIEHYPDRNSSYGGPLYYDNCALAHVNEKANVAWVPHITWWDLSNYEFSRKFRDYEFKVADGILGFGVLLNVFGILLSRRTVVWMAFIVNLGMASIYTFEWT